MSVDAGEARATAVQLAAEAGDDDHAQAVKPLQFAESSRDIVAIKIGLVRSATAVIPDSVLEVNRT